MTEDQARDLAAKLCAELGEGWKSDVWENTGWYCRAVKGDLTVYPKWSQRERYSAWLEPANTLIGNHVVQFIAYGETAEDALGNVKQDARTMIARIEAALAD